MATNECIPPLIVSAALSPGTCGQGHADKRASMETGYGQPKKCTQSHAPSQHQLPTPTHGVFSWTLMMSWVL